MPTYRIKIQGDAKDLLAEIERASAAGDKLISKLANIPIGGNLSNQVKNVNDAFRQIGQMQSKISSNKTEIIPAKAFKDAKFNIDSLYRDYSRGQRRIKNESENLQKSLDKYQKKYSYGDFTAKMRDISRKTDYYKGQTGKEDSSLEMMRKYAGEYKAEFDKITDHFDSSKTFKMNDEEIVASFKNMEIAAKRFDNEMKDVSKSMSKTLDPGIGKTAADKVKAYMAENTNALKKYGNALKDIEDRYRKLNLTEGEKIGIDRDFDSTKSNIRAEGLGGKNKWQSLRDRFSQIFEISGIYSLIQNLAFDVPKQMFNAVKDVNAAQIELMKVSNASDNQLTAYWDEAAESAMKYGSTISDVISNTADWSRLGMEYCPLM